MRYWTVGCLSGQVEVETQRFCLQRPGGRRRRPNHFPAIHNTMQGLHGVILQDFSSRDSWVSWAVHGSFLFWHSKGQCQRPLRKECHRVEKWLSPPVLPIPRIDTFWQHHPPGMEIVWETNENRLGSMVDVPVCHDAKNHGPLPADGCRVLPQPAVDSQASYIILRIYRSCP